MSDVIVTSPAQLRALIDESVKSAVADLTPASDVLTTEQVAEMLKIDVRTVGRWVKSRGLPGCKVSATAWRFVREDVLKWMRDQAFQKGGTE